MKMSEIRRENLRAFFKDKSLPTDQSEKSYISQLLHGKASFGEKAARRLETTYGMGAGYLDSQPGATEGRNIVDEFAWVYNRSSQEGRTFLESAIAAVKQAFIRGEAQKHKTHK